MINIELKLTELGTNKFIDSCDIFYDVKERPKRYQVANATLGCVPDFMLCTLDIFDSKGQMIATSTTDIDYIFNLPDTVEGLPEEFVRAYVFGGGVNHRVRFNGNVSEIYYLSDDGKIINEIPLSKPERCILGLTELPIEPIGKFILDQLDIKPVMTHNGAYYHYADVCNILTRKKHKETTTDAVEFMNWTLSGDCKFTPSDEDQWNGPDYMETRITYTTQEVYEYYLTSVKQ
jgi:hypothetical protein